MWAPWQCNLGALIEAYAKSVSKAADGGDGLGRGKEEGDAESINHLIFRASDFLATAADGLGAPNDRDPGWLGWRCEGAW